MDLVYGLLSQLGATDSYADLCRAYLTARLISYHCPDGDYANTIRTCEQLRMDIAAHTDAVSPNLTDDNLDNWGRLCTALQDHNMLANYRAYLDRYAPDAVADWVAFQSNLPDTRDSTALIVLGLLLEDNPPSLDTLSDYWRERYDAKKSIYRKYRLDYDRYTACWRSVYLSLVADSDHRPSRSIRNAIRVYHDLCLPMTDLLHDYAQLYLSDDAASHKIATRGSRKRTHTDAPEGGKSNHDLLLETALMAITSERPTDVIRGLFYTNTRNDAGFECTVLIQYFTDMVDTPRRVLIVNPSPDMILRMRLSCAELCYAIPDTLIASLYQREFPHLSIIPMDNLATHPNRYDRLLVVARDLPTDKLMAACQLGTPTAQVLALIPEVSLTGCNSRLPDLLNAANYRMRKIITVPTALTQSKPRKKIILLADCCWQDDHIQLLSGKADSNSTLFSIEKRFHHIPCDWLRGNMTIADIKAAASSPKAQKSRQQEEAYTYSFSLEIALRYTLQSNRKNRVAGKVYYRAILRPSDKRRKHGDRLSPIIEKGLRKRTAAEVVAAIEEVAFDDRLVDVITGDVLDRYKDQLYELSLKTVWYCLRPQLLTQHTYQDHTAREMFCGSEQAVSKLIIGRSQPEDYQQALEVLLPNKEHIPLKYWEQINLILSAAKSQQYIIYHPLSDYLPAIRTQASKRQREVRNALTKKTLEDDEERRIVDYLRSKMVEAEDGLWLLGLIVMFVLPNVREVLALRWMDFVGIANYGTYQLQIVNYLGNDGALKPTIDRSLRSYRCCPVPEFLSSIILDYKQHLMTTYRLTDDQLAMCPIIIDNHNALKRVTNVKPCRLKLATAKCREYIQQAGIASNEIPLPSDTVEVMTSDLNQYHGNLYYTNLKYHLRHICGFSEAELCYVLGLAAPDTCAAHYCDYGYPALQQRMIQKLQRWTGRYLMPQHGIPPSHYNVEQAEGTYCKTITTHPTHTKCINILITPADNAYLGQGTLSLSSRYGVNAIIACIADKEDIKNG